MKKITILLCAILMAFTLNAQEKRMVTHFHNGTVIEAVVSEIDSITFYTYEIPVNFTITDATDITSNSALFVASVTGSAVVTDKGICYSSTNNPPTTADSKVSKGGGTGTFSVSLTGLTDDTRYFARPYAVVNSYTYYGEVKEFKTLQDGVVINGIRWATRNVAAHGVFVSNPEDYGALFQWGRKGDGHEQRTSDRHTGTVSGSNSFDVNGQIVSIHAAYGKFITSLTDPYDWRSPQINTLWNSGTESSPIKTANDPCPTGWRVPTKDELQSLIYSGSSPGELNTVYGRYFGNGTHKVFFPAAGCRFYSDGSLNDVGSYGNYWSSTPYDSYYACYLNFSSGYAHMGDYNDRAYGLSVRCVSE